MTTHTLHDTPGELDALAFQEPRDIEHAGLAAEIPEPVSRAVALAYLAIVVVVLVLWATWIHRGGAR